MGHKLTAMDRAVNVAFEGDAVAFITNSRRPSEQGGMVVNSVLDKREWADLDAGIIRAAKLRLNGIADLRAAGLAKPVSLATMMSQWRVASEKVAASVNMDGRSAVDLDRIDMKTYGVPVPIISSGYRIPLRVLMASRRLGEGIDVTEAEEAAAAVVEKEESILFNGESSAVVGGVTIPGYTSISARLADTATNFGGGDFGTISNIFPTFLGMVSGLATRRYHGPFTVYVAPTQYIQMLSIYTDGSGQSALQRVLNIPQIDSVKPADLLADGSLLMVQLTGNVVDFVYAQEMGEVENREWEAPDGSAANFKVMAAMAPRIKTDYAGYTGIAHATGA